MNKLLSSRGSVRLFLNETRWKSIKNRCYSNTAKLEFSKDETIYLQENSETKKVKNFKKLSNILNQFFDNLNQMKWINTSNKDKKLTDGIELILKFNEFNPLLSTLVERINNRNDFQSLNDYFLRHLDQFSPKEQAILFRVINLLDKNYKTNPLVLKLEKLYYDQLELFDLNDLLNYHRGFFMLRKPFAQSKFESFSRSADIVNKKVLQMIDSIEKPHNSLTSSVENIFPNMNLTLSGLPLVLSAIRLYSPILTMDTQIKYFEILIEKAKNLNQLKDNVKDLADLFIVLDKIYIQNLNKNYKIFNSYYKYKNLFEENFQCMTSNLNTLSEDFERFELFIKFFSIFSGSQKQSFKGTNLVFENFKQKLANSNDSQNIYKYIFSITMFRRSFDTNRNCNFRKEFDLDQLMSEKTKEIIENMDFFSIKRLLGTIDQKFLNFRPRNFDLIRESLKINSNTCLINDNLIYSVCNFFPIFFNNETADQLKSNQLYPLYASTNLKYLSDNLSGVLESFEENLKFYLFEDQLYINEFVNNLSLIEDEKLLENSDKLVTILNESFQKLIETISLNKDDLKIKPISISKNSDKIDLSEMNYDYKPVKNCKTTFNFIDKLAKLLEKKSIDYGYIDLSELSMENFQSSIENFQQIFNYMKSNNFKDENLDEYLKFNTLKLVKYLFLISRLVKISQYYSPSLSNSLMTTFLKLSEILCDPEFESLDKLPNRMLNFYEHLFRFTELYSLYDVDCKEANISDEQKEKLEKFLNIIYQKLRDRINVKEIIKKNYRFINLNILNENAIEDFKNVVKNKSDMLDDKHIRLSRIVYQCIQIKFPENKLDFRIDLYDRYRDFSHKEFHEKFLSMYGDYVNKNPIFDHNLRTNYSFVLDKNGQFLKNGEIKPKDALEIPVRIIEGEQVFKNTNKIKRNILNYIDFMQKKYPVLILFQKELTNKTEEEIGKLVENKLLKSIKDFVK